MLMTAHIAPCSFWMTLLTDALPLLEQKEVSRLLTPDGPSPPLSFLPGKGSQTGDPAFLPQARACASSLWQQRLSRRPVGGSTPDPGQENRLLTRFPAFRRQQ